VAKQEDTLKTKPSEIVSGVGVFVGLITELDKRVRVKGGTNEDWHRLVKPEGEDILDQIATLIARGALRDLYPVEIQRAALKELIQLGHHDWVNSDITSEHFPLDDSQFGKFDLVLVHLNRVASTEEVLAHLDANDLAPAKIGHLLAFGAKYPNVQREFPIIARGSSWVLRLDYRLVPYLVCDGVGRGLGLSYCGIGWLDRCRFLALRK
jgi:hypothetical protein